MIENEYGQPVGEIVENLGAGSLPQVQLLQGRFCRLEKLSAEKHGSSLREVYASPPENWTYLSIGPITDADGLAAYLAKLEQSADPYWFAIVDQESGRAVGTPRHQPAKNRAGDHARVPRHLYEASPASL